MNHYKYIHFLWSDELKFQKPVVEMINNSDGYINAKDHLFLTPSEMVIKELGHYSNVVLFHKGNRTMADIINHYSKYSDWMISHGMANHVYQIKRKNLRKMVWRTWGGSRQKEKWDNCQILRSIFGQCRNIAYYLYYRFSYGCSPVIGIANTVDVLDLEQWNWHKNSKLFFLNYGGLEFDKILENTPVEPHINDEPIKFMVGHQGSQGEHHVDMVKRLLTYKDENFEVYLPLSYGDKEYIKDVRNELMALNDSRIHIMSDFMPLDEYLKFLADIDIAIIDQKSSMALGNICFLLYFRKKILLNRDGILTKAFVRENLPYGLCDLIGKIPFPELVTPVKYKEPLQSDIVYQPYKKQVQNWADMFSYLDTLK